MLDALRVKHCKWTFKYKALKPGVKLILIVPKSYLEL